MHSAHKKLCSAELISSVVKHVARLQLVLLLYGYGEGRRRNDGLEEMGKQVSPPRDPSLALVGFG
jgi:hypothetical protein